MIGNKPCGGLLAPDAQKLMAHRYFVLPKDILVDPQIFSVKTIDLGSGLICNYQRYYLNMDRRAFDKFLLTLIPNEVTRINAKLVKAERSGNGFKLSVSDSDKARHEIECRFLVGADGASSIIRRSFLIERYTSIQPYNSGLRETVKKALSIPVSLIKRQVAVAPGPFIRTAM